jgi:hypothetical protein
MEVSDLNQAFQVWMSRQIAGSRMNKETRTSLDPATQKVWNSIDEKDKAAILGYAEKRAEKRAQAKSSRSANVHEGDHGQESDDDTPDAETSGPKCKRMSLRVSRRLTKPRERLILATSGESLVVTRRVIRRLGESRTTSFFPRAAERVLTPAEP